MASSRRKQDDKHLKILRDLVSQPFNRSCFDCQQKGPTYINMTIGSFVCTSCSGILRGLNPPHRVKSISMASFTSEEVDQIKSRGNQYCKAVWLGLHDGKSNIFTDTKDEHKIRDYMIAKYERKRFYVDPSVAFKINPNSQSKGDGSSSASTPSTENKPFDLNLSLSRPITNGQKSGSSTTLNGIHQNSNMKGSTSMDLLSSLGNVSNSRPSLTRSKTTDQPDPFSSVPTPQSSTEGFANFDNANIFSSASISKPPHPSPQVPFSSSPLMPISSSSKPVFASSTDASAASSGLGNALVPEDRYAALKDLDAAFKTQTVDIPTSSNSSTMFGTSPSTTGQPATTGSALFGSSPMNGAGNGLYPAPPANNQSWSANFSGHNPFTGTASSWPNGQGLTSTNPPTQGTNQVNPFARGPDSNFNNQFAAGFGPTPKSNVVTTNGGWSNLGASSVMQNGSSKVSNNPWGPNTSTPNPFNPTPIVPSGGSGPSFNPFL